MAIVGANRFYRRVLRRERVFRDRENPLEYYRDDELRARYRFRRETIVELINLLDDDLTHPTDRNKALPPLLQLCVALRFYACGSFLVVVSDTLPRISKASVCRCVLRVSEALVRRLDRFVTFPQTQNALDQTKRAFFCIGR